MIATFWTGTGRLVRLSFIGHLEDEDDRVRGSIEYGPLTDGSSVPLRAILDGPGDDDRFIIEMFDYERPGP